MGGKFYYRMIDDESFCLTGYYGNETSVVIPECSGKLTVIFDDIFKRHPEITHVEMPDTVTDIGGFVFDGLWNLKELCLSKSLKNLWQYAFTRCGIETVTLPEGVKTVSMFAFNECKNLKRFICPRAPLTFSPGRLKTALPCKKSMYAIRISISAPRPSRAART